MLWNGHFHTILLNICDIFTRKKLVLHLKPSWTTIWTPSLLQLFPPCEMLFPISSLEPSSSPFRCWSSPPREPSLPGCLDQLFFFESYLSTSPLGASCGETAEGLAIQRVASVSFLHVPYGAPTRYSAPEGRGRVVTSLLRMEGTQEHLLSVFSAPLSLHPQRWFTSYDLAVLFWIIHNELLSQSEKSP